ncbi:hypothetical protein FQA39_LY15339 [Lamprigera yunnana]|nr:hypothetical protein FQA39_LY15339 [Lamprigera yunnana]
MHKVALIILLVSFGGTLQEDSSDNEIDFEGVVESFLQSESGLQIGSVLLNMGASNNANQIIEGIGAILGNGGTGSLDPSFLRTAFDVLTSNPEASAKTDQNAPILSWLIEIFGKEGGIENLMSFLPMVMSSVNSFLETEGQKTDHSGHDWLLPPIIEKVHLVYENFMRTEFGRTIIANFKEMKAVKMFSDENGKFDLGKFGELLENHSFRKMWIEGSTSKISEILTTLFDPNFRKNVIFVMEGEVNNVLKKQGFPKHILFDSKEPIDSLSAIVNFGFKKSVGYQIRSKQYVKPVFEYFKDIYNDVVYQGYFSGKKVDGVELSNKLADIINLEILEPVIRVYRAFRYAKKHPKCDRYVICLINDKATDSVVHLPKIKEFLNKLSSLGASWFLSEHTGTSFWALYTNVMEPSNCKSLYHESCDDFHAEEIKVKKQYVHNEL